jgi:hypothetical protein
MLASAAVAARRPEIAAAVEAGRPFRTVIVPKTVPTNVDDPRAPLSREELTADERTVFGYFDPVKLAFATENPRLYREERVLELTTLEAVLAHPNILGDVFNPLGGNHDHQWVRASLVENAINTLLNTPEKAHLLTVVDEYEVRTVRRQLFEARHADSNPPGDRKPAAVQYTPPSTGPTYLPRASFDAAVNRGRHNLAQLYRDEGEEDVESDDSRFEIQAMMDTMARNLYPISMQNRAAETSDSDDSTETVLPPPSQRHCDALRGTGRGSAVARLHGRGSAAARLHGVKGPPPKRPLPAELADSEEGRTALAQILEHIKSSRGSFAAYHLKPRQYWFEKFNEDLFNPEIPGPFHEYKMTEWRTTQRKFSKGYI